MTLQFRPIQSASDLDRMIALAAENPVVSIHVLDLPYRFSSWALDDPANTALWFDSTGDLIAWAVLQAPFWTIDYAWKPGFSLVSQPLLAWAERRARQALNTPSGRPAWFIPVFAEQPEFQAELNASGFQDQSQVTPNPWSQVQLLLPATTPLPPVNLPSGFILRPLAGRIEIDDYVTLHQAVFDSKNMTHAWRLKSLQQPAYQTGLDWVAVTPDGTLAGFCIGWTGEIGRQKGGQIEPLGIAEGYRHLGLGQALLSAVIRQLRQAGAAQVWVETDQQRPPALALYTRLGFRIERSIRMFRKEFTPG